MKSKKDKPVVHYLTANSVRVYVEFCWWLGHRSECGLNAHDSCVLLIMTNRRSRVTCANCKRSRRYRSLGQGRK